MGEKGFLEKLKSLLSSGGKKKALPRHEDNPPCCREGDTLFDPSSDGGYGNSNGSLGYSSPCSER